MTVHFSGEQQKLFSNGDVQREKDHCYCLAFRKPENIICSHKNLLDSTQTMWSTKQSTKYPAIWKMDYHLAFLQGIKL